MLSDKFKMRRDLEFIYRPQLIRSAHRRNNVVVSGVNVHGTVSVYYAYNKVIAVAPVCTI